MYVPTDYIIMLYFIAYVFLVIRLSKQLEVTYMTQNSTNNNLSNVIISSYQLTMLSIRIKFSSYMPFALSTSNLKSHTGHKIALIIICS